MQSSDGIWELKCDLGRFGTRFSMKYMASIAGKAQAITSKEQDTVVLLSI